MNRMSTMSRTVIWRKIVQASANMAGLPLRGVGIRPVAAGPQDRLGRADGPGDRSDVVDPQDVGAALDRKDRRGDRAFETVGGRPAEDLAQERLPRETEKE